MTASAFKTPAFEEETGVLSADGTQISSVLQELTYYVGLAVYFFTQPPSPSTIGFICNQREHALAQPPEYWERPPYIIECVTGENGYWLAVSETQKEKMTAIFIRT
ncbi:hypothetical protein GPALN_015065 [Globodera pallida]|nr:hypothetical protein GPALN_015065 [Globodera pallida]